MKEELRGHRTIAAKKSRRRADPDFQRGMQRLRICDQAGVIRTSKPPLPSAQPCRQPAVPTAGRRPGPAHRRPLVADRLVLTLEALLDRLGPRPGSPWAYGR